MVGIYTGILKNGQLRSVSWQPWQVAHERRTEQGARTRLALSYSQTSEQRYRNDLEPPETRDQTATSPHGPSRPEGSQQAEPVRGLNVPDVGFKQGELPLALV